MPDKCLECPVPSADMDGFIVSGPGGAPRSESAGVSGSEGPFAKEAPQTGNFILKGRVSSSSPLPDTPEPGWAYEAAEAGTYGGVQATVGDVVWCAGVNPVRWTILQSDSGSGGSSVSVRQILSSGTKIATVMVDGQATDLYCKTGGGVENYELAFSQGALPGENHIFADLSSYKDGAIGFLDVVAVVVSFGGSVKVTASSPDTVSPSLYAVVDLPDYLSSGEYGIGLVRFWSDGDRDHGLTRVSSGGSAVDEDVVAIPVSESYYFDRNGELDYPYFSGIDVACSTPGGDIGGTRLNVYVRRAVMRSE